MINENEELKAIQEKGINQNTEVRNLNKNYAERLVEELVK